MDDSKDWIEDLKMDVHIWEKEVKRIDRHVSINLKCELIYKIYLARLEYCFFNRYTWIPSGRFKRMGRGFKYLGKRSEMNRKTLVY